MHFKIAGRIINVELIASGKAIRERKRLWKAYGKGRWRKLKGIADVQFADGYDTPCGNPLVRSPRDWANEYKIKRILG